MPDLHRSSPSITPQPTSSPSDTDRYRIIRKGSVYNLIGPNGRVFPRFKSASVVGPRWEELTHTPWPYASSAYESGLRLWELGLIERRQVGQRRPALDAAPQAAPPPPHDPVPAVEPSAPVIGAQLDLLAAPAPEPAPADSLPIETPAPEPVAAPPARPTAYRVIQPAAPPAPALRVAPRPLALPAPRINLDHQRAMIDALRKDPARLFEPAMRQTLQTEVEYHLPRATWAAYLLRLLDRYERRQRRYTARRLDGQAIMHKHIAWQEQRQQATRV